MIFFLLWRLIYCLLHPPFLSLGDILEGTVTSRPFPAVKNPDQFMTTVEPASLTPQTPTPAWPACCSGIYGWLGLALCFHFSHSRPWSGVGGLRFITGTPTLPHATLCDVRTARWENPFSNLRAFSLEVVLWWLILSANLASCCLVKN
jgi:hypothetical protein